MIKNLYARPEEITKGFVVPGFHVFDFRMGGATSASSTPMRRGPRRRARPPRSDGDPLAPPPTERSRPPVRAMPAIDPVHMRTAAAASSPPRRVHRAPPPPPLTPCALPPRVLRQAARPLERHRVRRLAPLLDAVQARPSRPHHRRRDAAMERRPRRGCRRHRGRLHDRRPRQRRARRDGRRGPRQRRRRRRRRRGSGALQRRERRAERKKRVESRVRRGEREKKKRRRVARAAAGGGAPERERERERALSAALLDDALLGAGGRSSAPRVEIEIRAAAAVGGGWHERLLAAVLRFFGDQKGAFAPASRRWLPRRRRRLSRDRMRRRRASRRRSWGPRRRPRTATLRREGIAL